MTPHYPFLIALQFLTRLPVRMTHAPAASQIGHSLLYYPLVGLILGFALVGAHAALSDTSALLRAALVLAAWVLLTGALHLDGLADSADAWVGGLGDRQRTLAIMKDPYCGPMAVVSVVVTLLVKFAALHEIGTNDWLMLALIPALARSNVPLLFLTTRYVRAGGLGTALAAHTPKIGCVIVTLATWIVLFASVGEHGLWLLLSYGLIFLLLRGMMLTRLGGTTGDTAGALIELSETTLLVTAALA